MSRTQGILLAGVHRWDSASLDRYLPRPLLPIGNTLLISYALRWLRDAGVTRATVCANSASRLVRQLLGDGAQLSMDLDYYEDWTPRGPGGCVRDAVSESDADQFVVLYATLIPQVDLRAALAFHERRQPGLTVVASTDVSAGGACEYRPVGIYVFSRDSAERIPETGYQDLKEILIPRLRREGKQISLLPVRESSPRVMSLASYLAANEWMLQRLNSGAYGLRDYEHVGEAWIHRQAALGVGARLVGPVMVGPNSRVDDGAMIVGPSVIGTASRIDAGAVVARSVIWDRARVGANAYVDRSVLPNEADVAARAQATAQVIAPERGGMRRSARERIQPGDASSVAFDKMPAAVAGNV